MASWRRINEADLDRLEALLDRHVEADNGLDLEALDGLMAAAVIGPEPVDDEAIAEVALNGSSLASDADEAAELRRLLAALRDDVLGRVSTTPPEIDDDSLPAHRLREQLMPLVALPPEMLEGEIDDEDDLFEAVAPSFPLAARWAGGFLLGVHLRGEAWQRWSEQQNAIDDDLDDLYRLSLVDPSQLDDADDADIEIPVFSDRLAMLFELPDLLNALYLGRLALQRPTPVQAVELPGRNDPCPCGSGRKFKKCCGDPSRVH